MAWRAALEGVPWHTVFRRFGIVLAAAQVVNAVRGVGITRALRRKLRRARRASAKRKRAADRYGIRSAHVICSHQKYTLAAPRT